MELDVDPDSVFWPPEQEEFDAMERLRNMQNSLDKLRYEIARQVKAYCERNKLSKVNRIHDEVCGYYADSLSAISGNESNTVEVALTSPDLFTVELVCDLQALMNERMGYRITICGDRRGQRLIIRKRFFQIEDGPLLEGDELIPIWNGIREEVRQLRAPKLNPEVRQFQDLKNKI